MFDLPVREARGRCSARTIRNGLPALCATVLALTLPALAFAQSEECVLDITLDNATTIRALQFEIDHGAAPAGGFATDGACTFAPPGGIGDAEPDTATDILDVGWAGFDAFTGPGAFATCTFIASSSPSGLVEDDLPITVTDHSGANPPEPASPAPVLSLAVATCTPVAPECGNAVVENGEECDGGDACGTNCRSTGSCSPTPLTGCRSGLAEASKIKIKNPSDDPNDQTKDQAQYAWKKGDATDATEFKNPVGGTATYSWCVYDDGVLVMGADVPAGGTCDDKPCWKAAGSTGFGYKSKAGAADGISQIKLKAGEDEKASIQLKGKSKDGNFAALALPLDEPVTSQFVITDGTGTSCFETVFSGGDNEAESYSATGP